MMLDMIISILTDFALLEVGTDEIREVATQIVDFETDLSQVIYQACLYYAKNIFSMFVCVSSFKQFVRNNYRYGLMLPLMSLAAILCTQWKTFTLFGLM